MSNRQELIDFINKSKTAFQGAQEIKNILNNQGYSEIKEEDQWELKKGGKYYITKNNSAVIAFEIGTGEIEEDGFRLIGAHTDSPGFRIKPNPEMLVEGHYLKLNTEVYGGPILSTWFDRPLSIAGRVTLKGENPFAPKVSLVDINKPVLIIPNLAIHMNRSVNEGYEYNKQKDVLPLFTIVEDKLEKDNYLLKLISESLKVDSEDILDFDLFLYEYAEGMTVGLNNEFISCGRLDDLWMVFAGLKALINSNPIKATKVLVALDNEEIGSLTQQGANSSILENILERISLGLKKEREEFRRAVSNSIMISADLAHAIHPNYTEKCDPTSKPLLGKGPVLKIAASGSYSTDSYASAIFKAVCEKAQVPCQVFVNRSDLRGGTTIGPITAAKLNIPVIDMGAPVLSMHSVRELASVADNEYTIKAFTEFFN
ncbi:aspartyl aminopeptidase [Clostridium saccharoperbutylacetonicum]|uniref:M18 family aminopeptidase n=1 Tax=Clostridium saccharoperbutylacetonicum N1-4(HMT) TaxID=931276 RepID=M1N739_9CLOT|nr:MULTISPECIES: M18 family aminopeptidase [Clostridium]AGF59197.1 putative M18 family aminopeptidase 2 [Clostridium saccharoperbutylacetonicum N1-4(HMT)]NRT60016.1 aspartyl aminopeptidase [Clostridium saccharoperbutylacetonicum]NSB23328.1 aspartyl aminopeptidase [Clostridium saccharoperbutylacetonicum]NSB42698.1 aspartyl aminopeptidase [Clostridium saccharoperbutylacetonicum]